MVTVTDDPSLPASVQKKYVLEGEKLVMAIHQHPVVVSEPVATALAILAAVVAVDVNVTGSASALVDILWWVWFAAVARAAVLVFDYRQQWIIATDKRIMRTHGFFVRKVAMMPLSKVTDMSYHRSIPGRILGWGTFVMESAGTQQALSTIPFVPNPDDNYRALCAQIFGVDDARVAVADPQGRQEWVDEDGDGVDDRQSAYLVEPGPMSGRFVSVPRRPRAPRNGHDTADLPVVDPVVAARDAEARDLLSGWERFAQRYDEVRATPVDSLEARTAEHPVPVELPPTPGVEQVPHDRDTGTTIYRSGDDPLT